MDVKDILEIVRFVVALLGGWGIGYGTMAYKAFLQGRKREKLFFSNSQRPVAIFETTIGALGFETRLLKDTHFLNVQGPFNDIRDTRYLDGASLIVINYEDSEIFWEICTYASTKQIPTIIFSIGWIPDNKEDPESPKQKINRFPLATVCNHPLRIISDTFSIISALPHSDSLKAPENKKDS